MEREGRRDMRQMQSSMLTCLLYGIVLMIYAVFSICDAKPSVRGSEDAVIGGGLESWAVRVGGEPKNVEHLALKHGLRNRGQIGNLRSIYLLTMDSARMERDGLHATDWKSSNALEEGSMIAAHTTAALLNDDMVVSVQQQKAQLREKRGYASPSDPGWKKQWSLMNSGQAAGPPGLDLRVEQVWMQGINGSNVIVGIVDDGLEWTHTDIVDNYDAIASYDFVWEDEDPTPDVNKQEPNSHGTSCAGEVAMSRDCSCGVGVAFGSNIAGLKMDFNHITDAMEARALGHKDSRIDIYSNSWGPPDNGFTVEKPGPLVRQTLAIGAREGREGKGSIYVWAAGNGGKYHDSCAADGYVNSIYTIAVGSADQDGHPADYDEPCSAKMAVTFSYNSKTFPASSDSWKAYNQVYTTTLGNECTDGFTGTSASAPLVTGVIALTLQTNPDLTWRDVQYLIVYTSNPDILTVDDLTTNGAGLKFSHSFGFGAIDAEAMVTRARHWTNVPEQQNIHIPILTQSKIVYGSDDMTFTVSERDIVSLEHVLVSLTVEIEPLSGEEEYDYKDFYDQFYNSDYSTEDMYEWLESGHPRRGDVKIELSSPSGTLSTLLPNRDYDFINSEGYDNWSFMSVHFWEESPVGSWTLRTSFRSFSGRIVMKDVSVTMYGLGEPLQSNLSSSSSCHPQCVKGCWGEGPTNCDSCKNLRLLPTLECVDKCPNGTHPYSNYCISGDVNGPQCPGDSDIDLITIGLTVGILVLLLAVLLAAVGAGIAWYRRIKKENRFRRLFDVSTSVHL